MLRYFSQENFNLCVINIATQNSLTRHNEIFMMHSNFSGTIFVRDTDKPHLNSIWRCKKRNNTMEYCSCNFLFLHKIGFISCYQRYAKRVKSEVAKTAFSKWQKKNERINLNKKYLWFYKWHNILYMAYIRCLFVALCQRWLLA